VEFGNDHRGFGLRAARDVEGAGNRPAFGAHCESREHTPRCQNRAETTRAPIRAPLESPSVASDAPGSAIRGVRRRAPAWCRPCRCPT
jgi:hypothetical protein